MVRCQRILIRCSRALLLHSLINALPPCLPFSSPVDVPAACCDDKGLSPSPCLATPAVPPSSFPATHPCPAVRSQPPPTTPHHHSIMSARYARVPIRDEDQSPPAPVPNGLTPSGASGSPRPRRHLSTADMLQAVAAAATVALAGPVVAADSGPLEPLGGGLRAIPVAALPTVAGVVTLIGLAVRVGATRWVSRAFARDRVGSGRGGGFGDRHRIVSVVARVATAVSVILAAVAVTSTVAMAASATAVAAASRLAANTVRTWEEPPLPKASSAVDTDDADGYSAFEEFFTIAGEMWRSATTTACTVDGAGQTPKTSMVGIPRSAVPANASRIGPPSMFGCAVETALHCRGWTTGDCVYPATLVNLQKRRAPNGAPGAAPTSDAQYPQMVRSCPICDRHAVTSKACKVAAADAALPGATPLAASACPAVGEENEDVRLVGCGTKIKAAVRAMSLTVVWSWVADALEAVAGRVRATLGWWWGLGAASAVMWGLAFLV